jgi:predicted RNA-binding Zn-ribbon protein involved in translation (DUF1610 family)
MPTPLKVLFYDLETAPSLAYVWGPREDWIPHDRMATASFTICWSASWLGENKIHSGCVTPDEARDRNDSRIVGDLLLLILEADVLVGHNINGFDLPMFNNRLMMLGLPPMGPKRTIDTCQLAKRNFRLHYNKLDYLAAELFGDHKLKTDFKLWLDCIFGDEIALGKMLRYNKKDVKLLKRVYDHMLPYVKGTPKLVSPTFNGEDVCPHCGSSSLIKRGFHHTNVSSFRKYQCDDCGKYHRSRTAVKARFAGAPL